MDVKKVNFPNISPNISPKDIEYVIYPYGESSKYEQYIRPRPWFRETSEENKYGVIHLPWRQSCLGYDYFYYFIEKSKPFTNQVYKIEQEFIVNRLKNDNFFVFLGVGSYYHYLHHDWIYTNNFAYDTNVLFKYIDGETRKRTLKINELETKIKKYISKTTHDYQKINSFITSLNKIKDNESSIKGSLEYFRQTFDSNKLWITEKVWETFKAKYELIDENEGKITEIIKVLLAFTKKNYYIVEPIIKLVKSEWNKIKKKGDNNSDKIHHVNNIIQGLLKFDLKISDEIAVRKIREEIRT